MSAGPLRHPRGDRSDGSVLPRRDRGVVVIAGYTSVIVAVELSGPFVGALPGAVVDAILVPILLVHFLLTPGSPTRRMMPALALVAMLRTLSIAAVVPRLPEVAWYATIGAPMLVAIALGAGLTGEMQTRLGLAHQRPRLDAVLPLLGIPASFVGYLALRPDPLIEVGSPGSIIIAMAVLAVFPAGVEEGRCSAASSRQWRAKCSDPSELGTCTRLRCQPSCIGAQVGIPYTILIWLLGLGLGIARRWGASLSGLILCHAMILWGMALIWPVVLNWK